MQDRVTIVTVTHNGGLVIGGLLGSIPENVRLIVVDNASTDDSLDIVRSKRPDALILQNEIGLGYGGGANRGLGAVETEFALLVNPDTIMDEHALERMLEAADSFPDAAMFAPLHLNRDGSVELSHDVRLWDRRRMGKRRGETVPEGPLCAEFLSGAVNMVRMSVLRETGFYDPEIFLYYEDDDMCLRLRQAGHSLVLVPDAVVTHLGGGSVRPNRAYYWEKFWHIAWSRIYLEGKYRGRLAKFMAALRHGMRYLLKMLGNIVRLRWSGVWRDMARMAGTFASLIGVRASRQPKA